MNKLILYNFTGDNFIESSVSSPLLFRATSNGKTSNFRLFMLPKFQLHSDSKNV